MVQFLSSVAGPLTGQISIGSNDANESPYRFAVAATASLLTVNKTAQIPLSAKDGTTVTTFEKAAGTTVTILSGDDDRLFEIGAAGSINLRTDLIFPTLTQPDGSKRFDVVMPQRRTYHLELQAIKGSVSEIKDVVITIIPIVGLTGDTHVIEGTDVMQITFARKSSDYSESFDANFSVDWGTVTPELDLTPTIKQKIESGIIHFAAGQKTVAFNVSAPADGDADEAHHGIEIFKLQITSGDGYEPFGSRYRLDELGPERQFTTGHPALDYYILDGITAFAGFNSNPNKDDSGGTIHYNDVDQAIRPNCYCTALMAGMAYRWESEIRRIVEELPGGAGFKVTLFGGRNADGTVWTKTYSVEEVLSLGFNEVTLSGDYDSGDRAEVWPQLIDMALLDFSYEQPVPSGFPPGLWYGSVHTTWYILTGNDTTTWNPDEQSSDQFINQWSGVPIVLTTKSSPTPMPTDLKKPSTKLSNIHTYLFLRWDTFNGTPAAVLYDPRGVTDQGTLGEVWIRQSDVSLTYFADVIALKKN